MFVANLTGAVTSVTSASTFANNSPAETVILLQAKVNACVGIVSVVVVVAICVLPSVVVVVCCAGAVVVVPAFAVVASLSATAGSESTAGVVCSSCCASSFCGAVPWLLSLFSGTASCVCSLLLLFSPIAVASVSPWSLKKLQPLRLLQLLVLQL